MVNRTIDNVKLGIFVLVGLVLLVVGLYMVSKNSSIFGKNYTLRVHFDNVGGILVGNNIRYSGIQAGTIRKINLLNDTVIEVTMQIEDKMKSYIHNQDIVAIGTDGLVGNKVLNITPGKDRTVLAKDGDLLVAKQGINTDEMMEILNKTNKNIADISDELKTSVQRLNSSTAFWKILNDESVPANLKETMVNIRKASSKADGVINKADNMVAELQSVVRDIKGGKGSIGGMIKDTTMLVGLNQVVDKLKTVGDNANNLATELNTLTQSVKGDINSGKGAANALLRDSAMVQSLNKTLNHIETGTDNFSQNMEALKHNFLFRGYFNKLEKKKKKGE